LLRLNIRMYVYVRYLHLSPAEGVGYHRLDE